MAMAVAASSCGTERASTGTTGPTHPATTVQAPQSGKPRTYKPDFVGTITSMAQGRPVRMLVEASRSEPVGALGDKASLRVDGVTQIWTCGPTGPVAGKVDDLTVGETVSVWVDGPVAESYPVQATASAIHIGPACG
jgi:hypothetical protein